MPWIKRNLSLVVSGVIALGLLGFGSFYLWSALKKNTEVDNEIGSAKAELERLLQSDPFPSKTNIDSARAELQRVNAFIGQAKKVFGTPPPSGPLNNQTFKSLLQTTIDDLHKQAHAAGVRVETNAATGAPFFFSFEAQRLPMTFPPESLHPLYASLYDIHAICSVLFKAKVNRLEDVRRAAVPGEVRSGPDYLNEMPRANPDAQIEMWPYEFTFQCFSPELADVLENLVRLPQMAIVRSIVAEPTERVARGLEPGVPQPPQAPQARVDRFGRFTPAATQTNRTAQGLETLLDEHALRVVMRLEVLKPEPTRPEGRRGGGPGGPRGPGGP